MALKMTPEQAQAFLRMQMQTKKTDTPAPQTQVPSQPSNSAQMMDQWAEEKGFNKAVNNDPTAQAFMNNPFSQGVNAFGAGVTDSTNAVLNAITGNPNSDPSKVQQGASGGRDTSANPFLQEVSGIIGDSIGQLAQGQMRFQNAAFNPDSTPAQRVLDVTGGIADSVQGFIKAPLSAMEIVGNKIPVVKDLVQIVAQVSNWSGENLIANPLIGGSGLLGIELDDEQKRQIHQYGNIISTLSFIRAFQKVAKTGSDAKAMKTLQSEAYKAYDLSQQTGKPMPILNPMDVAKGANPLDIMDVYKIAQEANEVKPGLLNKVSNWKKSLVSVGEDAKAEFGRITSGEGVLEPKLKPDEFIPQKPVKTGGTTPEENLAYDINKQEGVMTPTKAKLLNKKVGEVDANMLDHLTPKEHKYFDEAAGQALAYYNDRIHQDVPMKWEAKKFDSNLAELAAKESELGAKIGEAEYSLQNKFIDEGAANQALVNSLNDVRLNAVKVSDGSDGVPEGDLIIKLEDSKLSKPARAVIDEVSNIIDRNTNEVGDLPAVDVAVAIRKINDALKVSDPGGKLAITGNDVKVLKNLKKALYTLTADSDIAPDYYDAVTQYAKFQDSYQPIQSILEAQKKGKSYTKTESFLRSGTSNASEFRQIVPENWKKLTKEFGVKYPESLDPSRAYILQYVQKQAEAFKPGSAEGLTTAGASKAAGLVSSTLKDAVDAAVFVKNKIAPKPPSTPIYDQMVEIRKILNDKYNNVPQYATSEIPLPKISEPEMGTVAAPELEAPISQKVGRDFASNETIQAQNDLGDYPTAKQSNDLVALENQDVLTNQKLQEDPGSVQNSTAALSDSIRNLPEGYAKVQEYADKIIAQEKLPKVTAQEMANTKAFDITKDMLGLDLKNPDHQLMVMTQMADQAIAAGVKPTIQQLKDFTHRVVMANDELSSKAYQKTKLIQENPLANKAAVMSIPNPKQVNNVGVPNALTPFSQKVGEFRDVKSFIKAVEENRVKGLPYFESETPGAQMNLFDELNKRGGDKFASVGQFYQKVNMQ